MDLTRKVTKKSLLIMLPLVLLFFLMNSFMETWRNEHLRFLGLFGNPALLPMSIVIGWILGIANLKGLVWGIDSLLGTQRANTRLVFLSLFRLGVLFAIIIILAALRLINLLGLLVGMTVVFIVLIIEAIKIAKEQGKESMKDEGGTLS